MMHTDFFKSNFIKRKPSHKIGTLLISDETVVKRFEEAQIKLSEVIEELEKARSRIDNKGTIIQQKKFNWITKVKEVRYCNLTPILPSFVKRLVSG